MSDTTVQMRKNSDEKFCADCAAVINTKAEICPKCGVRQTKQPLNFAVAENGKSKLVAILLAVFLGFIGGHKFYLGQVGMGILYAVFFWTGIPAIVGLIEGVLLLIMPDEVFNRKYGWR